MNQINKFNLINNNEFNQLQKTAKCCQLINNNEFNQLQKTAKCCQLINNNDNITDNIKIEGFVEINNGDTIIKGKNKFVQTLLQTILNFLASSTAGSGACYNCIDGPADPNLAMYKMYIGTDIITATLYNTTALTSPIGASPGTAPNTLGATQTNPSNGVFRIVTTATWNPNTVSGTVGEMALYMNLFPAGNLRAFQWGGTYLPSNATLASRFAAADGAFSPFLINTANPLTIVWTIQLSFV